jgi:hypothetical protein
MLFEGCNGDSIYLDSGNVKKRSINSQLGSNTTWFITGSKWSFMIKLFLLKIGYVFLLACRIPTPINRDSRWPSSVNIACKIQLRKTIEDKLDLPLKQRFHVLMPQGKQIGFTWRAYHWIMAKALCAMLESFNFPSTTSSKHETLDH